MKPQQGEDPSSLVRGLKQETLHLKGFPLVLQLVAFRAILKLLSIIPAPRSSLTIMELEEDHLPDHPSININDVLTIEAEENVSPQDYSFCCSVSPSHLVTTKVSYLVFSAFRDTNHTNRETSRSWMGSVARHSQR